MEGQIENRLTPRDRTAKESCYQERAGSQKGQDMVGRLRRRLGVYGIGEPHGKGYMDEHLSEMRSRDGCPPRLMHSPPPLSLSSLHVRVDGFGFAPTSCIFSVS